MKKKLYGIKKDILGKFMIYNVNTHKVYSVFQTEAEALKVLNNKKLFT